MSVNDLYLLAPELSLAALAAVLVLVDLVVRNKTVLPILAVLGLAVPLIFSLMLWFDLSGGDSMQMHGMFNTLVVDKFSLFFKFLLIAAAGVVVLSSTDYVQKFARFQAEYYALVLFATTGMMLLASTTELITIYISLELTALPIAALAAFMRDARSTESGMKFLILSAISSAVLLYGMVIVYGFTGSTSLPQIAQQISSLDLGGGTPFGSNALLFGIVLMIAGFGFKVASVPFQMWAPDVYEGSPTPITQFLSVASKAAGFAVILRVFYIAFPTAFLISLRNAPQNGLIWLFVVYAITWGTDTFAYVFGKTFGRTKLAPLISPNKTVEGAIGGILAAWIPAFSLLIFTGAFEPKLIPMIVAGPFLAVSGDLFESALKRFFRVKDSYVAGFNVFPGHGGVLDRIDALVWVASWVFLYLFAVGAI